MLTHLERFLVPAHVGPAQPSQAVAQAARQSGGTAEPDLGGMSRGRIQRQLRRVQPLSRAASWMFSWIEGGAAQRSRNVAAKGSAAASRTQ